uniref:Uncharacterized protein n=1 Tax=Arundo donax TaxID=35708 RepID=A0A0A9AVX9_ARUDO
MAGSSSSELASATAARPCCFHRRTSSHRSTRSPCRCSSLLQVRLLLDARAPSTSSSLLIPNRAFSTVRHWIEPPPPLVLESR